jgi:hypothetical protein
MTIETDVEAFDRAKGLMIPNLSDADKMAFFGDGEVAAIPASATVNSIFLVYMRINDDGTFAANQYFYKGDGTALEPSLDEMKPGSVGAIAKDMIIYARTRPSSRAYDYIGQGLDDMRFPSYRSYCVFMFDDKYWKFLVDTQNRPVVTFHKSKNGKTYEDHPHAFKDRRLATFQMTNSTTGEVTARQAAVMINTMKNKNNQDIGDNVEEKFCFDLWMRIKYAHSGSGVTLIIDPTGGNMGPPK